MPGGASKPPHRPDKATSGGINVGRNSKIQVQQVQRTGKQVAGYVNGKFVGRCDDLQGYIYNCSDSRQADLYTTTTKELVDHVTGEYKQGKDIAKAIESLSRPKLDKPEDPSDDASKRTN